MKWPTDEEKGMNRKYMKHTRINLCERGRMREIKRGKAGTLENTAEKKNSNNKSERNEKML